MKHSTHTKKTEIRGYGEVERLCERKRKKMEKERKTKRKDKNQREQLGSTKNMGGGASVGRALLFRPQNTHRNKGQQAIT